MKPITLPSGSLAFVADWPAPDRVQTLITTRQGGVSQGAYDSFNLGTHVGDDPEHVAENRRRLQVALSVPIAYLNQVHGTHVVAAGDSIRAPQTADASFDDSGQVACAVMTADCLPVLFCHRDGHVVAAAHAGWRGLAAGVLHTTVNAMRCAPRDVMAWLGPAIGAQAFEVGAEVKQAFMQKLGEASRQAFVLNSNDKYLANLYQLARMDLQSMGVEAIYGGGWCTYTQNEHFYSYRRNAKTGRMASIIWKNNYK